jgi:hypothetical protein
MPRTRADSGHTPINLAKDRECPKCGAETEPIEIAVEGLPIEQLQLCPACYLVTWRDHEGFHIRQGSPVKEGEGGCSDRLDRLLYASEQGPSLS